MKNIPVVVRSFTDDLIGFEVSYVWRGYGSAIFLELGKISEDERGRKRGEATVCIEWSWRIDNEYACILGTWDEDSDINKSIDILQSSVIKGISFFLNISEIDIEFEDGKHLVSFTTVAGDPHWYIRNKDGLYLSFESGSFCHKP